MNSTVLAEKSCKTKEVFCFFFLSSFFTVSLTLEFEHKNLLATGGLKEGLKVKDYCDAIFVRVVAL